MHDIFAKITRKKSKRMKVILNVLKGTHHNILPLFYSLAALFESQCVTLMIPYLSYVSGLAIGTTMKIIIDISL